MDNKKSTPILSIIIPVFNTEQYIARCLESIVNQSLKSIEIIMVDDLSTDNSAVIISEYLKKYDFIKYFKVTSKGSAGGARNIGLEKAKGTYIGFVDSDDWVDTMMFEKMVHAADKCDADIAMCGVMSEFGNAHESLKRHEFIFENIIDGQTAFGLLTRLYNQDMVISPIVCNKIYRTTFIKNNHCSFLINNYNDDDVFNFICFLHINKMIIVPNTYYHYFQRQDSIMHIFFFFFLYDFLFAYSELRDYLDKKDYFTSVKANYYAYLELNLAAMFRILIGSEPILEKQSEHIGYFLNKTKNNIIVRDYLIYAGVKRLIRFLTPPLKR